MSARRSLGVALWLFATGCPGDDGSASTSSEGSSSGVSSSTAGPPTGGADDTTATSGAPVTGGIVTGGADDGSGSGTGATGESTSTDTGGGSGDETHGGGSSSSGEPPMLGDYGDCVGAMLPCPDGAFCLLVPGSGVCTPQGCNDASECPPPPPGGDAPVTCLDANGDDVDDCRIDCSGGQTCPTAMECFSDEICVWS